MKRNVLNWALIGTALLFTSCSSDKIDADATGTFETREVIVSSEANGRIVDMNLTEGMELKSGISYGQIDTVQLSLQEKQLLASVAVARSKYQNVELQTASLRERISAAAKEKKRVEELIKAGAANQKQLDELNSSLTVLNTELNAAEFSLNSANASIDAEINALEVQLEQIREQLRRSRIVSPISGVVLAQYAQEGEMTGIGKPLFKVADLENMYLRAYVISSQLDNVKIGQKVKVLADMGKGKYHEYEGVVSWISDKAEFTPKTVQTKDERANLVYAVKVAFKNDGYAKIGMYGDLKF